MSAEAPEQHARVRAAYLCSRFPHLTETFIQREVRALDALGVDFDIYSLWGGETEFEGRRVRRFRMWSLWKLFLALPYWLFRRPKILTETAEAYFMRGVPNLENFLENMLGVGVGLIWAKEFRRREYTHLHAVWASLPATAAWLVSRLTGLPFSTGAHAYDVFQDGGDWVLEAKLREAALIQTSSQSTRRRLLTMGADSHRILFVRRGLNEFPRFRAARADRRPLRILSVGRLVEKMGYARELHLLAALERSGLDWEGRIAGGGPLKASLEAAARRLGLGARLEFCGQITFEQVLALLDWADVLLFCGMVARSGDRAGLPNIIPEAMAAGVPVVASPVGGVVEAIAHGETGWIAEEDAAVEALRRLAVDDELYARLRENGRRWTETHFNAQRNATELLNRWIDMSSGAAAPAGQMTSAKPSRSLENAQ